MVKGAPPPPCDELKEWVTGEITVCPSQWFNEFRVVFDTHVNWTERNTLPHAGGYYDQPVILMTLANVVADEVARCSKKPEG